jgi:hypothetical protein
MRERQRKRGRRQHIMQQARMRDQHCATEGTACHPGVVGAEEGAGVVAVVL